MPLTTHHRQHSVDMLLEDFDIAQAVLDKLRSDQLSGIMPGVPISSEDTVSKKVMPVSVELFAFAVVGELCGENGFDIDLIKGHDDSLRSDPELNGIWMIGIAIFLQSVNEILEDPVLQNRHNTVIGNVDAEGQKGDSQWSPCSQTRDVPVLHHSIDREVQEEADCGQQAEAAERNLLENCFEHVGGWELVRGLTKTEFKSWNRIPFA